jgi:glycosyltransferase involved in cell wall biosynthesis
MQYRHFPEDFPPLALAAMRRAVPSAVRRSAVVLAPSEFSRQEIFSQLPGTPPDRVVVTPEAADPSFAEPLSGSFVAERVLALTRAADPVLLAVGNTYPHKDLATAVAAYGRICDRIPHRLVLVGRPRRGEAAVEAAVAELPPGARFSRVGYALSGDLAALYQGADALVFPSRYEGFGLPVLEAMTAGLPVVAAREGSVPEVAGDAALYARTGDPDDFARVLLQLLDGPGAADERARLAALGRARAARFSWGATAEATLAALRGI